ncbi:hypothetical protein WJX73_000582 [Symbiochloris irregularis]|uniref:Nucleolar protein 6 n=1 Tax=Symbiochloris irregularis TaxID=706552 RepID=A0AAW1NZC9_9CHLO
MQAILAISEGARFSDRQASELLQELKDSSRSADTIEAAFARLAKALRRLPERKITAEEAAELVQALGLTCQPPLHFLPPEEARILGGPAAGLTTTSGRATDVAICIPKGSLYHKDQLNDHYTHRRAVYLGVAAAALKRHKWVLSQEWTFLRGTDRKPTLVVKCGDASTPTASTTFNLIPVISAESFPAARLAPQRNNLRPKLASNAAPGREYPATPHYNNELCWDMWPACDQAQLQSQLQAFPGLSDCILLLKAWAQYHGLCSGPGALSGWLLACFAGRIASAGGLVTGTTPLQMLKAILLRLSRSSTPFLGDQSIAAPATANASAPDVQTFVSAFECVFLDYSGHVNFAAGLSGSKAKLAQTAAKRTVALLNNTVEPDAAFDGALLTQLPPGSAFDCWWHVTIEGNSGSKEDYKDLAVWREVERSVQSIAERALGARASLVHVFPRALLQLAALDKGSVQPASHSILVAAQMDPEHAGSLVDIGPDPNSPQAADFRAFWGDKAELRRFQDGRILEAVAWQVSPAERHMIPDHVLQYALTKHLGSADVSVRGCAGLLDRALATAEFPLERQMAAQRQLQEATDLLAKQLRSLPLALVITAVQPRSPAARRTAAFPPEAHPLAGAPAEACAHVLKVPRCLQPVELLVQLEGSGRWPKHPEAYHKTKAALGLQIADELASGFGLRSSATEDFVDVFAGGFAFRFSLHSARDDAILKEQQRLAPQAAAQSAHAVNLRSLKHHALIAAAVDVRPALATTIRLLVRWLGAHLLSNHITQEAAELLATRAFFGPSPLPVPGSPLAGFMRVLHLISHHPWKLRPLIVDPADAMTAASVAQAQQLFDTARAEKRAAPMALVTAHDLVAEQWTSTTQPSAAVLRRLVALAKSSLSALQAHVFDGEHSQEEVFAKVFCAPFMDFDILVTLHPDSVPGSSRALSKAPMQGHLSSRGGKRDRDEAAGANGHADANGKAKSGRTVLTHIPQGVLDKHGHAKAQRELLTTLVDAPWACDGIHRR